MAQSLTLAWRNPFSSEVTQSHNEIDELEEKNVEVSD
jgi:hypothetical protein